MSMETHAMNRQLNPEEAFDITLLVMAEISKNILLDRNSKHEKRKYWIGKLDKDIEGINKTYAGYLPDYFQVRAEKFYKDMERLFNKLLKDYRAAEDI